MITDDRLEKLRTRAERCGEMARAARSARPELGDMAMQDRDRARAQLFALGGMESDLGLRDNIDWYRRRALLTSLDMLEGISRYATELIEEIDRLKKEAK